MGFNLINILYGLPGVLIAISVHEFGHAFAADKMGDPTAKNAGRMTLDPMAHFDPLGFLMLLIVRMGWAKPVPINERNFKNPKRGLLVVSLAGIVLNLLTALLFQIVANYLPVSSNQISGILYTMIVSAVNINIGLAAFNIIPIPPLDGSKVLSLLLPPRARYTLYQYENYSTIILFALLITGLLQVIIWPLFGSFYYLVQVLASLVS